MARTVLTPVTVVNAGTFNTASPGTSYAVVGSASYNLGAASEITAFVLIHQEPGGTSPTLDLKLQESWDGTNWVDLVAFAQWTGGAQAGVTCVRVPGPGTSDAKTFALYVRFVAKVGGTTPVYTATVAYSPKE